MHPKCAAGYGVNRSYYKMTIHRMNSNIIANFAAIVTDVVLLFHFAAYIMLLFTCQCLRGVSSFFAEIPRTAAPKCCFSAFCVHREACYGSAMEGLLDRLSISMNHNRKMREVTI